MEYMNKVQSDYSKAKAAVDAIRTIEKAIEKDYCEKHGLTGPTGIPVEYVWMVEDEELFNQHNEALAKELAEAIPDATRKEANDRLKIAEDALIEFGLSLTPEVERQTLIWGLKHKYDIREKLIDLTFRLDTRTIGGAR